MQVNFLHRNVLDTVVILEEGNLPHPKCPQVDMLVPYHILNGRHPATAQYARGAEQKRRRLSEADLMESTEMSFKDYGAPLKNVTAFKYLGWVMTTGDDDWHAVVGNLQRVRKSWGRLSRILIRKGADPNVSGHF